VLSNFCCCLCADLGDGRTTSPVVPRIYKGYARSITSTMQHHAFRAFFAASLAELYPSKYAGPLPKGGTGRRCECAANLSRSTAYRSTRSATSLYIVSILSATLQTPKSPKAITVPVLPCVVAVQVQQNPIFLLQNYKNNNK